VVDDEFRERLARNMAEQADVLDALAKGPDVVDWITDNVKYPWGIDLSLEYPDPEEERGA
jgi:hypothetical protein